VGIKSKAIIQGPSGPSSYAIIISFGSIIISPAFAFVIRANAGYVDQVSSLSENTIAAVSFEIRADSLRGQLLGGCTLKSASETGTTGVFIAHGTAIENTKGVRRIYLVFHLGPATGQGIQILLIVVSKVSGP
jgi:hypothetical protein